MSPKQVDIRISELIKKCLFLRHRSMFFILGETSRCQVVFLYHLLVKYRKSSNLSKPIPLWCFKKDLGLNLFQNKKLKKLKKNCNENISLKHEDVFEHFLLSSNIQVCHYSESDKILGQTFGFLVIQDFDALTPNTLARIIECVEGGGMIIFLLPEASSLKDICSLHMDAHSKFVTEAYDRVTPLFNKRFALSLISCENCLVLDDSLNIKLISEHYSDCETSCSKHSASFGTQRNELRELPADNFSKILSLCCTPDQTEALKKLSEALKGKNALCVTSLTSGRGRGKSAVLGLAVCSALDLQISNIYITSPHLENVQTLFSFLIKGLQILDFKEEVDFKVTTTNLNNMSFTTRIQMVHHHHRQTVSYVPPLEHAKVGNADLVVIDEAAAIPSAVVKQWIGPFNVFMASTINGYEGTGRSLSLKLISQIRAESLHLGADYKKKEINGKIVHNLNEISLSEAIRYSNDDPVEKWLNDLLCLEAATESLLGYALPPADNCRLYRVNKRALFSYNKCAEKFLQRIISLFVTSHYKNSPNDLLMIADAPAHQIFCLLPPVEKNSVELPPVLCVIQVALEGKISTENYSHEQSHGRRASGDLIPWIISQQFQEESFTSLAGARVVRIATHPDCQRMGYGKRALQLLCQLYNSKMESENDYPASFNRNVDNLTTESALLYDLKDSPPEVLNYVGVSYGLTAELLKFWKRAGFVPLYIRQTTSDVTGEHSCVMVNCEESSQWLSDFYADFTSRFVSLLPSAFKLFSGSLSLSILHCKHLRPIKGLSAAEMRWFVGPLELKRLDAYSNNLIDHHLILDVLPRISKLYFSGHLSSYFLSSLQEVILLCIGLQNKSIEMASSELNMEAQQVMGCFRKAIKKIVNNLTSIFQAENSSDSSRCSKVFLEAVEKRKTNQPNEKSNMFCKVEDSTKEHKSKKKKHQAV